MTAPSLEQVIRSHILLPTRTNAGGWFSVLCKVCNDHGRKGARAGFRFDGNVVAYNCFNCKIKAIYNPAEHKTMPDKMGQVLRSFGLVDEDWLPTTFDAFQLSPRQAQTKKSVPVVEPAEIPLPSYFVPLSPDGNKIHQLAIEYLANDRNIDYKSTPLWVCDDVTHPEQKRWFARLILPAYKDGKLIFYQGRDLTNNRVKKYLNCGYNCDNVLVGFDGLFVRSNDPLYVVEGWFDAYHIGGAAVLSNLMSQGQIHWLNMSNRPKVVIPDRFGDGHVLADQAIELGWSVAFPDIGSCKDVNEAVVKYGLLYVTKTIHDNTCTGFNAKARLGIYCKNRKKGQ